MYAKLILKPLFKSDFYNGDNAKVKPFLLYLIVFISFILICSLFFVFQEFLLEIMVLPLIKNSPYKFPRAIAKIYELVPYISLLVSSIILISLNTMIYLFDFFNKVRSNDKLQGKKAMRKLDFSFYSYNTWVVLLIIFACVSSILLYEYFIFTFDVVRIENLHSKFINGTLEMPSYLQSQKIDLFAETYIIKVLQLFLLSSEWFSIVVFVLFVFIDYNLVEAYYVSTAHEDDKRTEKEFVKNQMWFIDIPVLFGLIFTLILGYIFKNIQHDDPDSHIMFSSGVIAFQIAMSQLIFFILNAKRILFGNP